MNDGLFGALAALAASVGALHSLAPDHWVPFAAVSRARGWSAGRTARVTLLCGFGHVSASVVLGLVALVLGREVFAALGARLESLAGVLLIAFGLLYGLWGMRHAVGERLHGHSHRHYDHVHDPSHITVLGLFLLFTADPCVAVMPIMLAAAPLGAVKLTMLILVYETATLAAMVGLVLPARAGANVIRAHWIERYGDAAAGATIAAVGLLVLSLGW
jgi:nickel/cobalt transporter (NicO) family protein